MKITRLIKQNIPNSITCLNLLCGCLATVFAFRYDEQTFCSLSGLQVSFIFIGLATVFDFCDGLSARLLHAYSALGKELDSLSDLVSFGLAPAALVYCTMSVNGAGAFSCLAFVITIAGALRLAKFNIDEKQKTSFIGLPIPANAIFWIGCAQWVIEYGYPGTAVMVVAILIFSYLMVSRLRMFSLKVQSLSLAGNERRYALLIGAVTFLSIQHIPGLAWTVIFYIILSATMRRSEQYR